MKRIAALLLTLLLVVGLLPTVALAASSEEEALGEVQIYHDGTEMSYLSINGRVRTQVFTYYNYINAKGQSVRVPAYCVNPNTAGVPQTVPAGTGIKYLANQRATDPKIMGIVASGYPTRSLERLGLASEHEAYYATKMALWCYLLPNWDIADLTVNPAADQATASRVLAAAKLIYTDGMYWDKVLTPKITAVPDQEQAYPVTFEGKEYYQQLFTVTSETWVDGGVVYISFADPDSVPEGTRIVGLSGNDITGINCVEASEGGFSGQFKILYPAESIEGQSGSVQLTFTCDSYKYAIILSFAAYLKIAPNTLQIMVRTQKADMADYVARMKAYAETEENEKCREMIEDNIAEVDWLGASSAITRRFFLVFQYEPQMKAKRNTVRAIAQRLSEEADTARRYLDVCGLEVLEPRYADNTVLELLYELINKKTSRRVKLPEGVFDMTTAVHGLYETGGNQ